MVQRRLVLPEQSTTINERLCEDEDLTTILHQTQRFFVQKDYRQALSLCNHQFRKVLRQQQQKEDDTVAGRQEYDDIVIVSLSLHLAEAWQPLEPTTSPHSFGGLPLCHATIIYNL
jgi:hypothetical protein